MNDKLFQQNLDYLVKNTCQTLKQISKEEGFGSFSFRDDILDSLNNSEAINVE